MTAAGSTPGGTPGSGASFAEQLARWGSLVLQVGVGVFPLSASGLMAPPWALVVIALGWIVGLVAAWHLGRSRPFLALLVPVVTVAAWFALMSAGDVLFGWVA
jgi:hypothetical protein